MQLPTTLEHSTKKILLLLCTFFSALGIRLFYLQIYSNSELLNRAQKNFTRFIQVRSQRGNIVDAFGTLLATNRPVLAVYWQGTGNRTFNVQQEEIIALIAAMKNIDPIIIKNELTAVERYGRKKLLFYDITIEDLAKLIEKHSDTHNLIIEESTKRYYPYNTTACHVIGYIGAIQEQGKMGLEKILENLLQGSQGTAIAKVNSVGTQIDFRPIKDAQDGTDIHTTIDLSLQLLAEQCFDEEYAGVLLLMDPENGELKTVLSRPNFDPNIFLQAINSDQWNTLTTNNPFLNRAFSACYPPASPFKLISLAAALELNIISPETTINCYGYTTFYNRQYHCANKTGHGKLTVQEAVAKSCNILFYEIAKHISIDQIADYAYRFGLGQKVPLNFLNLKGLSLLRHGNGARNMNHGGRGRPCRSSLGKAIF